MEIIFATTGVECVAAPARGVIFLDPTLDYESAIAAIHASMPGVHIDAVRHWVDRAMPSAVPLNRARLAHVDRPSRFPRLRRATLVLTLAAMGAAAMWGGLWVKHRYIDNVFTDTVFGELARDRGWHCDRSLDDPMTAGCVTRDGVMLRILATASDTLTSFIIGYNVGTVPQMGRLLVFDSPGRARSWMALEKVSEDGLHPNLYASANWMLYGSEGARLAAWASVLPQDRGSNIGP